MSAQFQALMDSFAFGGDGVPVLADSQPVLPRRRASKKKATATKIGEAEL